MGATPAYASTNKQAGIGAHLAQGGIAGRGVAYDAWDGAGAASQQPSNQCESQKCFHGDSFAQPLNLKKAIESQRAQRNSEG